VTNALETSFLLEVKTGEHPKHAEALRLMSAFLDWLQDPRDRELAEICFDRRAQDGSSN
jgi:hypothetical protein